MRIITFKNERNKTREVNAASYSNLSSMANNKSLNENFTIVINLQ